MIGDIEVQISIEKEDDQFIATCEELDIASHGATVEEAAERLQNALILYFQTLAEDNELEQVIHDRNLQVHEHTPHMTEERHGPRRFRAVGNVPVGSL